MRKRKLTIYFSIFLILFLAVSLKGSFAQTNNSSSSYSSDSGDAIGVRIVPNPNHLSISRWYENQGFTGSPQELIVDGYDAIRDGRTVYVSAANVKSKLIFTNIYLISYNQDPSIKTMDILGQIVKNWKFNTDLIEKTNPAPTCSISLVSCSSDTDCLKDQSCSTSGATVNTCQLKSAVNCLVDADCPQDFFCNSVKAKIIRDIKRIGKFNELSTSLNKYKLANGSYPKLKAGTYISGYTVSTWPSWATSFLSEIGMTQSFVDPINRLGSCPGYDLKTCWNGQTNKFVNTLQANGDLVLPGNSYGFIYKTDSQGSNYNLCSVMETREATADLNFQFSPNMPATSNCVTSIGISGVGTFTNTAPEIVDYYLNGEANQEFNGFVKVVDKQNNPLTWKLNTGYGSDSTWQHFNWSAAPIFKDTSNPNQKKVYAAKAGNPGSYTIQVLVDDGQGGLMSTTTNINISSQKPIIEAENIEYTLDPVTPFNYSFYFSSNSLLAPIQNDYSIAISPSSRLSSNLLSLFSPTLIAAGNNRYRVEYSGVIPTSSQIESSADYTYRITVKDKYNSLSTKDFKIKIKNEAPSLDFNCSSQVRLGQKFSCLLGLDNQGNHTISYEAFSSPKDLAIIKNGNSVFLEGIANEQVNKKLIVVLANNEYGATSSKSFYLDATNYCGDGVLQSDLPNAEGRGGLYNDGYEDCDGTSGVTTNIASSNIKLQYACSTINSNTPYPILNNNYCVYKSPVNGGGYCGDGICEAKIQTANGLVNWETKTNCDKDCGACIPNCKDATGKDKICGSDGCGGYCGACGIGDICTNNTCCAEKANVQVAADDEQETYFNGDLVASGKTALSVSKFNVLVKPDKNVLAISAFDSGYVYYGISAMFNQGVCKNITTEDLANWKCVSATSSIALDGWNKLDYDDSKWPHAVWSRSNHLTDYNPLPYRQAWAYNALSNHTKIYCRYVFGSDQSISPACQLKTCSDLNKVCGSWSDGCAGTLNCGVCASNAHCDNGACICEPKSCVGQDRICGSMGDGCGNTLTCGTCTGRDLCLSGECVCQPATCDELGATCGSVSDGCGGTLSCGSCSGSTPVCSSTSHKCVACETNTNCSGSKPICSNNTCVACVSNANCSGSTPVCSNNVCVGCAYNNDCSGSKPVCSNNTCVACTVNANCSGSTPVCSNNTCVACVSDANCSGSTPVCSNNTCVACTSDANCSAGNYCSTSGNEMTTLCNPNAANNTCQKKCWNYSYFTKKITFGDGALLGSTACSFTNPTINYCYGNDYSSPLTCPSECPTLATGWGISICYYRWYIVKPSVYIDTFTGTTNSYSCSDQTTSKLYYGDVCNYFDGSVNSGTMKQDGTCSN